MWSACVCRAFPSRLLDTRVSQEADPIWRKLEVFVATGPRSEHRKGGLVDRCGRLAFAGHSLHDCWILGCRRRLIRSGGSLKSSSPPVPVASIGKAVWSIDVVGLRLPGIPFTTVGYSGVAGG